MPAAETEAEIETLAEALMAAHLSTKGCGVRDPEKARLDFKTEARRRLALYQERARDAVTGDDPERAALMAEEHAPLASPEAHRRQCEALMLAASPVASLPGAGACRRCRRGIWTSPSWPGPPPDLCFPCSREGTP